MKIEAARKALDFVESGMRLGIGSGSTAAYFIDMLGDQLRSGGLRDVVGVPTSLESQRMAEKAGIPLTTLAEHPILDLAVDGADEVDPNLNLIKGLGKALLREKIVETHVRRFIVIVDKSKLVPRLGMKAPLPVEIVQFAYETTLHWLNALGCRAELVRNPDGSPFVTDNGNYYAHCWFKDPASGDQTGIPAPYALANRLANRPGVVEHGLFLDMTSEVIVASDEGVRILRKGGGVE